MSKFSTLDLTAFWNTSRANEPRAAGGSAPWHPDYVTPLQGMLGGKQNFWGIPFELGPAEGHEKCWILLGDRGRESVTIPLSGQASFVVLAHFCNACHDPEKKRQRADVGLGIVTRPGEHLADYVLVYADGSEHCQAIRRRFEIGEARVDWGQLSFAARPQGKARRLDWRGPSPRGAWGNLQTAADQGAYQGGGTYWVYALPNPYPDKPLQAIRLEPTGADRLAIGGITLYQGRYHPLRHRRLETVRAVLPEEITVEGANVDVDMGVLARAYAVPAFVPQNWLAGPVWGWGEEKTPLATTRALFMDLTASPEATLDVAGHQVSMRDVYAKGMAKSQDGQVQVELLTPRKTWLHVTVEDASTGKPTPVRIHFRSPDGRYFPPYGHRHEVNDYWFEDYGGDLKLGSTEYAYVDGRFQVELPVGEVYVEIAKGFEYQPIRAKLDIQAGQRELKLVIQRPLNWRKEGWVTADTHVHFISPQTAWLEAQGEGLNLINLLASQWGDLFTNVADITGDVSGVSRDDTLIWVGTENRQHLLGHMSLLGVKGEPVFPMCASGPSESYLGDPTWSTLAEWSDTCRQREGLVVIPHFPNPYCEVVADIILGKVDAVEIRTFTPNMESFNITEWYRFLNLGYRVAAVGGTDKMFAGMPVGGVRTYAYLGQEEFSFVNWAKAVRAGRTFTTSGPLITLSVEGHWPGDEIRLPAGGGELGVKAQAVCLQPFHEMHIIANGQVVARKTVEEGTKEMTLEAKIALPGSGWVAARCVSRHTVWHIWPIQIGAHTSPVYIVAGGQELFSPTEAAYMLTLIEGGLAWLDTLSIPASPERHRQVKQVFLDAQAALQARLRAHS